ncbi:hypothetical protein GCM10009836_49300 [Pseudonocardia ailaonensis]|uniref:VIT family protein n=1 Tax=Pseudonocardia ailaonensis TaxID=367279 RepID=A0ABN2NDC8_9PSEU
MKSSHGGEPVHVAEVLRERVYGGLSCLSTLLVLTSHLDDVTPWGSFVDVLVGSGSLYAASVFAGMVGGLAASGRLRSAETHHSLRASAQIMQAAALPLLFLLLSGLHLLAIPLALWISIGVSIAALGLFALLAARRTELVWWKQALVVASLVGLGALVTLIKILAHG